MSDYASSFFDGKREWSEIKDTVLAHYIEAYLKKVNKLNRPIILVDAFAGPGKFGDGKPGSPLLMCQKAEKFATFRWTAIFVNKEKKHHDELTKVISPYIKKNRAQTIHSDARTMLQYIEKIISNHTLFLYLDPFGLKGCDFEILKPLLARVKEGYSTELLINISMPTLHRQGARKAVLEKGLQNIPSQTLSKIKNVDKVLGGKYWREIEWDPVLPKVEREKRILQEYRDRLRKYMQFVMSCPVKENEGSQVKYYITLCSRHIDALTLMNDTMGNAYNNYMHERSKQELPLFSSTPSDEFYQWERGRIKAKTELTKLVLNYVKKHKPRLTRKKLWEKIVYDHFMQFIEKEYREVVKNLVASNQLIGIKPDRKLGLNDNAKLFLPSDLKAQNNHKR